MPVKTVICKDCGLVYQNPRLDEKSLNDFYKFLYRELYDEHSSTISNLYNDQLFRGENISKLINRHVNHLPESVVEIGCGAGGILEVFQNNGCQILGTDFNQKYLNFGVKRGLNLRLGGTEVIPKESADLVILSHVLEHFSNIGKELNSIHSALKPNGYLYVEVPGIFNLRAYAYILLGSIQNAHNYYFTLETLEQVMNKYGWELVYGTEKIASLFRYTGTQKQMKQNFYPKIIKKINFYKGIEPLTSKKVIGLPMNIVAKLTNVW